MKPFIIIFCFLSSVGIYFFGEWKYDRGFGDGIRYNQETTFDSDGSVSVYPRLLNSDYSWFKKMWPIEIVWVKHYQLMTPEGWEQYYLIKSNATKEIQ